jgi:hypothetical protein
LRLTYDMGALFISIMRFLIKIRNGIYLLLAKLKVVSSRLKAATLCRSGVRIGMKVLGTDSIILGIRKLWQMFPIKQKFHTTAAFLDNPNF